MAKKISSIKKYASKFFKKQTKKSEVLFIRGYAKSGTNWVCNLLNLHPDINCKGEFHLDKLFTGLLAMQESKWSILNREQPELLSISFYQLAKELVIKTCENAPVCGDRTPTSIRSTFIPKVKNIYITRDGRDVIVSWAYHAFNRELVSRPSMKEKLESFKKNSNYFEENKQELLSTEAFVRGFSRKWSNQIVDDFKMMHAADRGENQLDYMWIQYEDLHQNTEKIRKKLYQYLEIDGVLAKALTNRTKAGIKKTNNTSFYRKGAVGDWENYFTDEQLDWFMEEASEGIALLNKNK